MSSVQDLWESLSQNQLFLKWKKNHSKSYLSHFFCQLDNQFKTVSEWQIGLFDSETNKITVFVPIKGEDFEIKPEDEVFKKEDSKVELLEMKNLKISFDRAVEIFKANYQNFFPKSVLGGGFVIVQTLDERSLWNLTFITKEIKFVNIKIDTRSGDISDHQVIEMVQK